jgi:hypothetical protein
VPEEVYFLSDSDREEIVRLLEERSARRQNTTGRPDPKKVIHPAAKTYVARIGVLGIPALDEKSVGTGSTSLGDDQPGEGKADVYQLLFDSSNKPYFRDCGFNIDVYNLTGVYISPREWVLVTQDKFGKWMTIAQELSFLAIPTHKTYTGGNILYSWSAVYNTGTTSVTYSTKPGVTGCPERFPAFHERGLDIPVVNRLEPGVGTGSCLEYGFTIDPLSIIRLRRGGGRYYIFDSEPWQDLFRRTGEFDVSGREVAFHRRWNQNTQLWEDGREVRLVDAE